MHIGILGGGHAGIEAAVTARQSGADVTVYGAEAVLPYFRPRLVGVAMGQTDPAEIAMHPAAWYESRGIRLNLGAAVTALDPRERRVVAGGVEARFDALVLACGALPFRPRFHGETSALPVFTLWSLADALAIRAHVRPSARLVVIGGGILAIECALRASERKLQVTVIERVPRLLPVLFGDRASALLRAQLEERGIAIRTGRCVTGLAGAPNATTWVTLDDGERLDADLVLACMGSAPNLELARRAGLAVDRGVVADASLQAVPGIFVAGDLAQVAGRPARGAVREAGAQGRLAGANAAAWLAGRPPAAFVFETIPVSLRSDGVELYAAGSNGGFGVFEQRLDDGKRPGLYRAATRLGTQIVGVQMVGSREGFDALAAELPTPG